MYKFSAIVVSLTLGLCVTVGTATAQQAAVKLGSNSTFAVLAGTTVTVAGGGSITGNVGVFPGTAYAAGTPAVTVDGTVYANTPIAAQAQSDLTTAYNDAAGRTQDPVVVISAGSISSNTVTIAVQ